MVCIEKPGQRERNVWGNMVLGSLVDLIVSGDASSFWKVAPGSMITRTHLIFSRAWRGFIGMLHPNEIVSLTHTTSIKE